MINQNFIPPAKEISELETKKRLELLPWVKEYFSNCTDSILVCGSLSYGADYSVSPESDIDIQLVLNDEALDVLASLDIFNAAELTGSIDGYKKGLYQQFSLSGYKNGVQIESHFWNKAAFLDAVTFKSKETNRLRTSIDTPSTDFGFSFSGIAHSVDFYGEMHDGYPVSVFPSYREVEGVLFLCRPITNILGGPIVLQSSPEIDDAIDQCWSETIKRLVLARSVSEDPKALTVVNALPSQYKMSPESKAAVISKMEHLL